MYKTKQITLYVIKQKDKVLKFKLVYIHHYYRKFVEIRSYFPFKSV